MPLFKRKPFPLAEAPQDLSPDEHVFQVRFTKEIFREYQEYLNRINLYRQRFWTCKVTGKVNLTYEEALVSERRANEKVQQFPKELMAPVLHMIQFIASTLLNFVKTFGRAHDENCKQLELERKKAQKLAESEKLKAGILKKESEHMLRPPVKSNNI